MSDCSGFSDCGDGTACADCVGCREQAVYCETQLSILNWKVTERIRSVPDR